MKRELKQKYAEDYEPLVARELTHYIPMASALGIAQDILVQAAHLGVRDGMHTHRASLDCKNHEEECVAFTVQRFITMTLVRACLLASSEDEMEKAESILMQLIEE